MYVSNYPLPERDHNLQALFRIFHVINFCSVHKNFVVDQEILWTTVLVEDDQKNRVQLQFLTNLYKDLLMILVFPRIAPELNEFKNFR